MNTLDHKKNFKTTKNSVVVVYRQFSTSNVFLMDLV